ncbi:MAG: hypothetical protein ACJAYU_002898 [Bradymonadia bacterium]
MVPFLSVRRESEPRSWTVLGSAYAARWAHGIGDVPRAIEAVDPEESRAIAQQYGRIPAEHVDAVDGTYGGVLWRAVRDDRAFERLFSSLFGVALFGIERSGRRRALNMLPSGFSALVLREFEVLRARQVRPQVEPTTLFHLPERKEFRSAIGFVVAGTLGSAYAEETATLCGGWDAWEIPPLRAPSHGPLVSDWLTLFEENND